MALLNTGQTVQADAGRRPDASASRRSSTYNIRSWGEADENVVTCKCCLQRPRQCRNAAPRSTATPGDGIILDALAADDLVEHNRGALPGNAVLPVVVGGVHRRAAEHASDGA
eukprot:CAMPEP_0172180378 /NCGR_PEP_ID=MMETSP1050-20130122/17189_1 /TAXON_ID=233186 /ORGANISM="Cryptomonas curvata, Strain CCAP979/52" /LENGTH=112 /DNA_ID=CAMNT_0012853463 /DNA_START=37 /DNA_END=371 /DNA_ORIENTATION=-